MVQMNVEIGRLRAFLDGRWGSVREEVRAQIRASDLLRPVHGLSVEEYRERVLEQARLVSQTTSARLFFPRAYGGEGDLGAALTALETVALVDLSLLVKIGVQFGLFGGVIRRLGTERHHQRYLRAAMTMELPGCFAMTETGHGSDVQSIRTTATYDPAREEFTIHTPDDDARKDYIGNVSRDGRLAAVFAQLITAGKGRGVHVFLVPIRDQRGRPCPSVRIEDCGHKGGLNGVDNGRLWFDQVRVPRDALLDRFGAVAPDGTYTSPIESETRRFFTMLGTLVSGRVSVSGAARSAAKLSLTIAVRHGLTRRQFHAPGTQQDVILLDYLQHQRRLLPALATTYAFHFAQQALVTSLHDAGDGDSPDESQQRQLETLAAGLKSLSTWHTTQTIQTCREACGGAGYLSENRLTELKAADGDAFAAFNAVQDHLLLAARAHVERVVLEYFIAAIDRCDDPETRALLEKVCDLHVLASLERDRGWFLEHGQLSAARAKAVITNVNRLCRELRAHARLLVDAFAIPEELLPQLVRETEVARSAAR